VHDNKEQIMEAKPIIFNYILSSHYSDFCKGLFLAELLYKKDALPDAELMRGMSYSWR